MFQKDDAEGGGRAPQLPRGLRQLSGKASSWSREPMGGWGRRNELLLSTFYLFPPQFFVPCSIFFSFFTFFGFPLCKFFIFVVVFIFFVLSRIFFLFFFFTVFPYFLPISSFSVYLSLYIYFPSIFFSLLFLSFSPFFSVSPFLCFPLLIFFYRFPHLFIPVCLPHTSVSKQKRSYSRRNNSDS